MTLDLLQVIRDRAFQNCDAFLCPDQFKNGMCGACVKIEMMGWCDSQKRNVSRAADPSIHPSITLAVLASAGAATIAWSIRSLDAK